MSEVVLITGSNMGCREDNLAAARRLLVCEVGEEKAASGIYESEPWGEMGDGGGAFLNQVLVLDTALEPLELLDRTQDIEHRLGRTSKGEATGKRIYSSRLIDIDILYYGGRIIETKRLTIPHPLMSEREFVLVPLTETVPAMKHPVNGKTAEEMLDELHRRKTR